MVPMGLSLRLIFSKRMESSYNKYDNIKSAKMAPESMALSMRDNFLNTLIRISCRSKFL